MRSKWVKVLSFLLSAALLLVLLRSDALKGLLSADADTLRARSEGSTLLLLWITFVLMLIHNTLSIVPLFLIVTVNISLFGFTGGYFWSLGSGLAGAMAAFLLARYWLRELVAPTVNGRMMASIEERGFWVVLAGRLLPLPSSVVNLAAGISSVGWRSYLYATVAGNAVYLLILAFLSDRIMSMGLESGAAGAALMALAVYIVYRYRKKKREERSASPAEQEGPSE